MTRAPLRHIMNHRDLLSLFRSSHRKCSVKKSVLKNFTNFTGKHLCWSLFLISLQVFGPATLLKYTPTLMFSYEICKTFKNTYFEKHLQKTASTSFTLNTITNSGDEFGLIETSTECMQSKYSFKRNNFNAAVLIKFLALHAF